MGAIARAVDSDQLHQSPRREKKRGYTQVPHTYFEHLPSKTSGQVQFASIGFIMRKTLGAEREAGTAPPEWATINNSAFARVNNSTERACEMVLADAVERRLIARQKDGRGYCYKVVPYPCKLQIKNAQGVVQELEFPGWEKANKYSPKELPKKPPVVATEREDDTSPTEASMETSNGKAALKIVKRDEGLVVMPGETSKPIPLTDAMREVLFRNESSIPLHLASVLLEASLLFTIKGNPNLTSGIVSPSLDALTRTGVRVSDQLPSRRQSDTSLSALLDSQLGPLFRSHFRKSLDSVHRDNIAKRLRAKHASTPEHVELYVSAVRKNLKRRPGVDSGILLNWADDMDFAEPVDSRPLAQLSGTELDAIPLDQVESRLRIEGKDDAYVTEMVDVVKKNRNTRTGVRVSPPAGDLQ